MARSYYSWRNACSLALGESDPFKALGLLERAISAIERRHGEWHDDPGEKDEVEAIRETISLLRKRLNRVQAEASKGAA